MATGMETGQGDVQQDAPNNRIGARHAEGGPGPRARPVLLVVLVIATIGSVSLASFFAWQWSRARTSVADLEASTEELSADLESTAAALQSRDTTVSELQAKIVQLRIAYDPAILGVLDQLRGRAADAVTAQAADATRSSGPLTPVEDSLNAVTANAETEFPVLAEVPGWREAISLDVLRQAQGDSAAKTLAAMDAEKKKAQESSDSASRYWCVDEQGRRINSKSGCEGLFKRQGAIDPEGMWRE